MENKTLTDEIYTGLVDGLKTGLDWAAFIAKYSASKGPLYNAIGRLAGESKQNQNEVAGAAFGIGLDALQAPLVAIRENSGKEAGEILKQLEARKLPGEEWKGFNAVTNAVEDLKTAGIIDPLKVTKMAFVNAISVAATYLTIGAAITDIPEKEEKGHSHGHGMEGMY